MRVCVCACVYVCVAHLEECGGVQLLHYLDANNVTSVSVSHYTPGIVCIARVPGVLLLNPLQTIAVNITCGVYIARVPGVLLLNPLPTIAVNITCGVYIARVPGVLPSCYILLQLNSRLGNVKSKDKHDSLKVKGMAKDSFIP